MKSSNSELLLLRRIFAQGETTNKQQQDSFLPENFSLDN